MEYIYLQNCGEYQITFEPALELLGLEATGVTLSPQG